MPAYIPTSNINLLDAWNLIDATSFLDAENTSEQTGTGGASSQAFTPGAITVWGFAFKFASVANSAATFTASIQQGGSNVSGTSVTISGTSIPTDGGWVVLKFSSPVTLLAATAYTIRFSSSVASAFTVLRNATVSNLSRALITTTTEVPTTNDQLVIAGHYTGTGDAGSDVTVTLNQTGSAVQFGTTALTQSISIARRGTLRLANASGQSYVMKHRGICQVRGGTLRLGSSGSRLDSTSSFVWTADCVSQADSGWHFHSGTVDIYGADNKAKWTTLEASITSGASKLLTVASTTGFSVGDGVYITTTNGTTRTQDTIATVTAINSSTTMTITSASFAHTGTNDSNGDRRARVVNLTRNVMFAGINTTLPAYIDHTNTAVVNLSYMTFWYLGSTATTTGKRGYDCRPASGGSLNMQYSCFYAGGTTNSLLMNVAPTAAAVPITIQHSTFIRGGASNVNQSTAGASATTIEFCLSAGSVTGHCYVVTGANFIVRNCEAIGTQAGGNIGGFNIGADNTNALPVTGDISNNYIAFCGYGILYSNGSSSRAYLMDNWTFVDCPAGLYFGLNTFFTHKERQRISGWSFTGGGQTQVPLTLLGSGVWDFINCTFNIGAGTWTRFFTLTTSAGNKHDCRFINCTFNNGSLAAMAIQIWNFFQNGNIRFINCTGMPTGNNLVNASDTLFMFEDMVVSSQKHNGTNDSHRAAIRAGFIETDSVIADTGRVRSCRITPASASVKCGSAMQWRIRVTGGTTITPQVRWRKSVVGDGAAYNGNQPRLIIKRNDAVGVSADTVLATATNAANGAWENRSGTSVTFTDEGEVCLYVDCDGTTGWINIDSITVGSESNDMTYWNDGMPVQYLSGGGSSASARNNPFLCQAVG